MLLALAFDSSRSLATSYRPSLMATCRGESSSPPSKLAPALIKMSATCGVDSREAYRRAVFLKLFFASRLALASIRLLRMGTLPSRAAQMTADAPCLSRSSTLSREFTNSWTRLRFCSRVAAIRAPGGYCPSAGEIINDLRSSTPSSSGEMSRPNRVSHCCFCSGVRQRNTAVNCGVVSTRQRLASLCSLSCGSMLRTVVSQVMGIILVGSLMLLPGL
mmetsp:Transcript_43529/g.85219  ORF Transcript_43529/g.85219 Transcript_43529/m.85219 type:complete len:218 (+) Transcript_43529:323-976(+)